MRFCGPAIAAVLAAAACLVCPRHAAAQYQAPSEKLLMSAKKASTWSQSGTDVVMLEGPVKIELDRATLTAKRAVVWITPEPGGNADGSAKQRVEVALLGDAKVEQPAAGATRSGERMLVTAEVAGHVQLTTDENNARDEHDTAAYREADAMRAEPAPSTAPASAPATSPPAPPTEPSAPAVVVAPQPAQAAPARGSRPATRPAEKTVPVEFSADNVQTVNAQDGTVAVVLTGNVILRQRRPAGELLELLAQDAVMFTRLKSLRELQKSNGRTSGREDFIGAYLEGDVRIRYTPIPTPNPRALGEQRLDANRVYYEFATDRAILTDVVIHTQNPQPPIPIVIHAQKVRQLAEGEYKAEKAEVSSSTFAHPTFGVAASRIYVREEGEGLDKRYIYDGKDATLRIFDLPVFYVPGISGVADNNESLLRTVGVGNQSGLGTAVDTEFGLFETLGVFPPRATSMPRSGSPTSAIAGRPRGSTPIISEASSPTPLKSRGTSRGISDRSSSTTTAPTTSAGRFPPTPPTITACAATPNSSTSTSSPMTGNCRYGATGSATRNSSSSTSRAVSTPSCRTMNRSTSSTRRTTRRSRSSTSSSPTPW